MAPSNDLVEAGGMARFAEPGHHYVVYSMAGNPHAKLEPAFSVKPGDHELIPPDPSRDWVLWISDGTNLNSGRTHPGTPPPTVRLNISPATATALHSR
jgi:hypothetical protein